MATSIFNPIRSIILKIEQMTFIHIPKKLHIVDFKSAPYTESHLRTQCSKSLEQYCMGWELRHWDEEDLEEILSKEEWNLAHFKTLYDLGAWAILSDIIRIYAMYTEGGLYVDWDVEFVRTIPEEFFQHKLVLGFEPYTLEGRGTQQIGAHLCMSCKGHPFWKMLYRELSQRLWTEKFNILPGLMTSVLTMYYNLPRLRNKNSYYYLKDDVCICPFDLFYPFVASRETNPSVPSSEMLDAHITNCSIALHWEFSQNINKGRGWANYLDALKHTPK